jgi:plastocyanin
MSIKRALKAAPAISRSAIVALATLLILTGIIVVTSRAATLKSSDLNASGTVDVFDLSIILSDWNKTGASLRSDINDDQIVNVFDLSILLSKWGPVAGSPTPTATVTPTPTQAATPTPAGPTVGLIGTSFTPSTVTIKVGQTVTFFNGTNRQMWPASNPHPVHTDYPGFEALSPVAPGDSWSFTFTKTGTWGYHDHLMPTTMGAVIVTN